MPYLIDRHRALRTTELVAMVRGRQRRVRSQLIFRDNSIYNTLTRPTTMLTMIRQTTGARAPARTTPLQIRRVTTLVWRAAQP